MNTNLYIHPKRIGIWKLSRINGIYVEFVNTNGIGDYIGPIMYIRSSDILNGTHSLIKI